MAGRWLYRTLAVTACVLLAACTSSGRAQEPVAVQRASPAPVSTVPASTQVLASVRFTGGMCQYGACDALLTIRRDGHYTYQIGDNTEKTGTVTEAKVETLAQEIAKADFERIKSVPFTGTCPIAYDGQELIYTFQTAAGPQVIASCKVQVDENAPLFKATQAIVAESVTP